MNSRVDKIEYVYPRDRKEWRSWLELNHSSKKEVWLAYYKIKTGKASISYNDSVEEAICFGWIDGIKKRIDDELYCHRFTPRRVKSNWSETNIRRGQDMIERGLMSPVGLELFKEAINNPGRMNVDPQRHNKQDLPEDLSMALKREKPAYINFMNSPESYRKMCIGWTIAAKKPDTRKRRIIEIVEKAKAGERIALK